MEDQGISPIADPLAGPKLTKKLFKLVKHSAKEKTLRRGVKEVVKSIRKGKKGLCVIAGDIYPIDVISHLPVYCEKMDVPYIFVPSKADLGAAAGTKRPTSCVLATELDGQNSPDKIKQKYKKIRAELAKFSG
ncbi:putative Ribosomal protein L7Ae/L30e/S12e/Gadd45 family [Monocercomonoides exilis]|uniref:putative Ribosomal protein L7Ae/L30e/S12e/Gadd45 family n=1 Tax=Monocercomonoides exilis TaxID=2049356 RepID=UPI00355A45E9|nr:putative Ribosomal protein L7Ae/L30e/S12e/Gadd45 family [Monocercomonoides exilis]|eukprot:MONOS_16793.1-p1 / transcript=MONOS_16793.1 / gene=MONOS_16793 / organism=Monocercomonoides_exilis_PA203 / gene_product=Ribosomal protein L7Ae/L30e/S12e/Gadd45 family / transcript_product=Ribosomal protein L7Ae/L30e/S12e/Gadd45 family / location=Mono_scaffold00060:16693-17284(-) / protein_length=132 / sequence_SO=supercontig / SO=protein_coding / is_pseudo=false